MFLQAGLRGEKTVGGAGFCLGQTTVCATSLSYADSIILTTT